MNDLTQQGVVALKSGNKIRARNLLKAALRQDPHNVDAWLWLSGAVDSDAERLDCLKNVLRLDPNNRAAARGYAQLTGQEWQVPPAEVIPPPAMVPMGEGAPPAALDQLNAAADDIAPAPAEEAEVDEGILREFPSAGGEEATTEEDAAPTTETTAETTADAETLEEPATGAPLEAEILEEPAAPLEVEVPDEATPEASAEVEEAAAVEEERPSSAGRTPYPEPEPRIRSWEELLGPSEADEPPAEEPAATEEVTDTQELRIGKPGSSLRFVTGPALGYGLLKLLVLLVVFAGAAYAAYYYLTTVSPLYIVYAAGALAVIWLILFLAMIVGSSSTRYTLTKEKLLVERGVLGKTQTVLPLADIEQVQPERSFLQKIGGVGDILVKARTDGQVLRLKDIAHFNERLAELENAIS